MFNGVCLYLATTQVTKKQRAQVLKNWGLFKYNLSVSVTPYLRRFCACRWENVLKVIVFVNHLFACFWVALLAPRGLFGIKMREFTVKNE